MKQLMSLVEEDIERLDRCMRDDLAGLDGRLEPRLFEILDYGLFGGGKRFRPLLALSAARLCGRDDGALLSLVIAFEYLHLATLFHDDVIDQADTRRGRPSVVKAFGTEAAILAGDFLHARSMELVGRYGGIEALTLFCQATRAMVDGEFIQLANASNYNQSEADYFRAIEGKTAVLISAATEIGALAGGGDSRRQRAMREYGRNLGYGFQIVDDLLDYQGDEELTGKVVGNDLAEGKMTLPLILALANAAPDQAEEIGRILADAGLRRSSLAVVSHFIADHGGFSAARQRAQECIDKALASLTLFGDEQVREVRILAGLARYALVRRK